MNPNRTCDLWCKKCLWHKCRCVLAPAVFKPREEPEKMFPMAHGEGIVKVSYGDDGVVTVKHVEPKAMPDFATTELQYTRTMTMDDLRRNALESVIEELKERDA